LEKKRGKPVNIKEKIKRALWVIQHQDAGIHPAESVDALEFLQGRIQSLRDEIALIQEGFAGEEN
jgi:hypothetical protein